MSSSTTGQGRHASPADRPADDQRQIPRTADGGTLSPLQTSRGQTTIADTVVAKIAGLATREVPGVYRLGGGAARAVDAVRGRLPGGGRRPAQGVTVEVGERQAAVDLQLAVDYGARIPDVAQAIRTRVRESVQRMTGLQVTEINIAVDSLHVEESAQASSTPQPQPQRSPRVQ